VIGSGNSEKKHVWRAGLSLRRQTASFIAVLVGAMMHDTANGAALLATARDFQSRIVAQRDAIEISRRLPEDLAHDLARAGFFRIFLPAAYGGLDLTPMDGIAVFEELAKADASVAWCVWNGNTHWTAAQLSAEAAHAIHDDPDVITANSTRPSGQAHVVDGGYRLTGRWSLVSGCEFATWMVLWSVIHEDGKPRTTPSGGPEIRFMLLPASQCEIIDTWTVGGLRGTGSHDVAVHDVFVPIAYASGFFNSYVLPEPRYRIPAFCRVIPGLGGMALGIACTAIATLKEQAPRPRCARGRCCAIRRTHRSECRRLRRSCGRLGSFCSTASLSFGQNFWRPAR